MRIQILLASLVLAGTAAAQTASTTLPKGWDTTEGADTYGTNLNSYFWSGFDIGATAATYNPSRSLYSYDSTVFPWNPANVHVITKVSFRRDGPQNTADSTAHTKKWVVILSTNTRPSAQANFNHFDNNHGTNRTEVFGKVGTPKDVTFKKTPAPAAGKTAPFDVEITLDKAFVVPANTKTLCVEIRSYSVTGATAGWWQVDSVRYPSTNYNGGSYTLLNSDHCVSPSIFYTSRAMTIGSNFGHIWRPSKAPGGKKVLTWLGLPLATPFAFPGTKCNVHVFPPLVIRADTSETSGAYAVYVDWGEIPFDTALIGAQVSHQSLFDDSGYAGGLGLTRGGTSQVGSGYDPKAVPISSMYSFGPNTTRYITATDPDKEVHPRYFYRRAPIIKIN